MTNRGLLKLFLYEGRPMNINQEQVIIRYATSDDARQIAEIIVEDWKIAYKGIIDSDFLDSMNVEERYQRELQRYQIYKGHHIFHPQIKSQYVLYL